MKYLFISLLSIFLCSCNSSLSSKNNQMTSNGSDTIKPFNISSIEDKYFHEQWYINKNKDFYYKYRINEYASINPSDILKRYSGKGIKIAVIDSGLDVYHEDLKNAVVKSYSLETDSSDVYPYSGSIHGTAVTGVIAARSNNIGIKGIASDSKIFFLQHKDMMTDQDTIKLFNKAEEWGADIINCSWGSDHVSEVVKEKIIDLANNGRNSKGISIVFSSGNDNKSILGDESNIKEVISIGSSNKNNKRSDYSNYGDNLDMLAPGGVYLGLTSLDIMGINGKGQDDLNYLLAESTEAFVGTSAASPVISGIIALMLEKNPELTRIQIENILKKTADTIGDIEYYNGRNDYYGYGKVNLTNIMTSID